MPGDFNRKLDNKLQGYSKILGSFGEEAANSNGRK